jgi:hypothetical protein
MGIGNCLQSSGRLVRFRPATLKLKKKMWKIILWIAVVYAIIGLVVGLASKSWTKGFFWIFFLLDDIDFPDFDGFDFD